MIDIQIPSPALQIIKQLEQNGFEAFLVGGCVRDSLMGKAPHDFDITTDAVPAQVSQCFPQHTIIETGLKHGTVTIMLDNTPFEVTTYRTDGTYLDNRHPSDVQFVRSLKEDLARRDFTINAMAYNPTVGLTDYFGGQEDLCARQIVCVGDPIARFQEDALRILRALRFSSRLGFSIEKETAQAILKSKDLLKNISSERLAAELNGILLGENAFSVLSDFSPVFAVVIPELEGMFGFAQNNPYHCHDVWIHTLHALSQAPQDLILRLTMLLHDIAKPLCYTEDEEKCGHFYTHPQIGADMARMILTRLKYDNHTINTVAKLVAYHDTVTPPQKKYIKRMLNKVGAETFESLLAIRRADVLSQSLLHMQPRLADLDMLSCLLKEIIAQGQCFSLQDLQISGKDLIDVGFPQGKNIGVMLSTLLQLVIDEKIANNKDALLAYIEANK